MLQKARPKGAYQVTTLIAAALLLLILFVSAAYFFFLPVPEAPAPRKQLLGELSKNIDTWTERRPLSYRYVVNRACACARATTEPYVATEERGDKTAAFTVAIESGSGEFLSSPPDPVWIDGLFSLIERSVRDGQGVQVEYDTYYGYPNSIIISRSDGATDVDLGYEVRDFEVLEYRQRP